MQKEKLSKLAFESKAVYYSPDPGTQAVSAPIVLSSNYQYDAESYQKVVDGDRETVNIYTRCGNPTEYKFEEQMALLEGSEGCLATASGMAAISTVIFGLLHAGEHIVADWSTYSTTHELFDEELIKFDVKTTFVDTANIKEVEQAITPQTKLIYFEAITNPNIKVPEIPPLVKLAKKTGITLLGDNTFASPYVLRPYELGVDIVVESATKFIGGHNDVLGGTIAAHPDFLKKIRWSTLTKLGGAISPFNAWLLLRGLQTLPVRVERQCQSALYLARRLEKHPKVERVWYPGLPSHPQHKIAKKYMPKFGAMLTFKVKDEPAAVKVMDAMELCSFAASLGGVRTTVQCPATMAFLDVPLEQKIKMGVFDGMVRISTGLEDAEDIYRDIEQALEKI